MVLTIHYPANDAENFAKGTGEGGVYFEVPAIFAEDGTCDEPATLAKVEQHLTFLQSMRT
jgi:hypothetical protein